MIGEMLPPRCGKDLDQVYCTDCIEGMRGIETASIDCIITDPPFFIPSVHYQSRVKWQRKYSDLSVLQIFWESVLTEIVRVLKPQGHIFVFCNGDSYPVFYIPMFNRFDKVKALVWDKGHFGLGRIFRNQHELIIWGRSTDCTHIDDGRPHSDVLRYSATPTKDRDHPVEKPEPLMMELISPTTPEGGVVLDPFCGSGTVLTAARKLNRHFIGFDLDPEYCKTAERKVTAAKEHRGLFTFGAPGENRS